MRMTLSQVAASASGRTTAGKVAGPDTTTALMAIGAPTPRGEDFG